MPRLTPEPTRVPSPVLREDYAWRAWLPEGIRAAGSGGLASLLDAMTRGYSVARTDARLRVSGPDRYRLDFSSRPRRIDSTTIACGGERRWRVYQDRILIGRAAPLRDDIAFLADSCWLLRRRLSGGAELTYRGRPARHLRVTPVPGGAEVALGPLMTFPTDAVVDAPTDAIVDAETGCLLRRSPTSRHARDLVGAGRHQHRARRSGGVPGARPARHRTVVETGNLFADAVAVMPGAKGTAARAAAEAVNRTAGAVSAARSFLDDLRGHR